MEKRSDGERTISADEVGAHFIFDSRFTGRAPEEDDLLGVGVGIIKPETLCAPCSAAIKSSFTIAMPILLRLSG